VRRRLGLGSSSCAKTYQIEIANRIRRGRAVGTDYVVTQRPVGRTGIIATFPTRDDAERWIVERCRGDGRS
jgi:hypothetical protein